EANGTPHSTFSLAGNFDCGSAEFQRAGTKSANPTRSIGQAACLLTLADLQQGWSVISSWYENNHSGSALLGPAAGATAAETSPQGGRHGSGFRIAIDTGQENQAQRFPRQEERGGGLL